MVLVDYYIKGLMDSNNSNNIKEKDWIVSREQILEALCGNSGFLQQTAEALNINRVTLWRYIKSDKQLQEEVEQVKESLIDFAESQLRTNIKDGKETSLIYFMNCKARHRGYGNFKQIEIIDKDNKAEKLDPSFL